MEPGVIIVVLLALVFDYTNGFHDAANSIATVVATRVLSPRRAVAWAAFFNFAAFLVFGTDVATTIAKDVVDPMRNVLTVGVVFAGLIGANRLEPDDLLPRTADQFLARPRRGYGGGRSGERRVRGSAGGIELALGLIFTLVIMWTFHRVRRVDVLTPPSGAGTALGGGVQPRPRGK